MELKSCSFRVWDEKGGRSCISIPPGRMARLLFLRILKRDSIACRCKLDLYDRLENLVVHTLMCHPKLDEKRYPVTPRHWNQPELRPCWTKGARCLLQRQRCPWAVKRPRHVQVIMPLMGDNLGRPPYFVRSLLLSSDWLPLHDQRFALERYVGPESKIPKYTLQWRG